MMRTNQRTAVEWERRGPFNVILRGKGFYISYSAFVNETAVVDKQDYLIIKGDHRNALEKLAPKGLVVCKKFFDKQRNNQSLLSSRAHKT
jgi:regulator of replication initiation timing